MSNKINVISYLKIAHWLGLFMVLLGVSAHGFSQIGEAISGMIVIATLIGLGLVMMSPFPIVLFIQWAQKQETRKD